MVVNRAKSGIMYLNWKAGSQGPEEKELFGYPTVREYRYLGGWINDKLKLTGHIAHVERKVAFVMQKLSPVRMLKDLKLNVNLFRTMCMPLYRMGMINSLCTTKTDQNEFYKVVRKRFKQFCYLPKCLPNSVVKMTLGGLEELAGEMAVRALKHLEEDGLGIEVVDVQHKVKYFKDLPRALYPVFDAMYRSACSEHNRILSRAELKVHSIEFNILQVLEDYQIKRRKNEINRQLRTLAATLQGIGRRFTSRATLTKPLPEENKEDETE